MSMHQVMVEQIKTLATALGEDLLKDVVFVGGCTVGIHVTDDYSRERLRHTEDIDLIISVGMYCEWHELEMKLTEMGFSHPPMNEDHPNCRRFLGQIMVDFMPIEEDVLGYTNRWYKDGMDTAVKHLLDDGQEIKVLTTPYFLGTKFEAFNNRGNGDYLGSTDIEDIVSVIGGREELVGEINTAPGELRDFIKSNLKSADADYNFDITIQSCRGDLAEVIYDRIEQIIA